DVGVDQARNDRAAGEVVALHPPVSSTRILRRSGRATLDRLDQGAGDPQRGTRHRGGAGAVEEPVGGEDEGKHGSSAASVNRATYTGYANGAGRQETNWQPYRAPVQ